jgi:hypothetical protein
VTEKKGFQYSQKAYSIILISINSGVRKLLIFRKNAPCSLPPPKAGEENSTRPTFLPATCQTEKVVVDAFTFKPDNKMHGL